VRRTGPFGFVFWSSCDSGDEFRGFWREREGLISAVYP
jgi:hypothetical protein